MTSCFSGNAEFHGDLSAWDVSRVECMDSTFQGSGISDSGIGNWDVGAVTFATCMFDAAPNLSPELDLSRWNVGNLRDATSMFSGSAVVDNGIGAWRLLPGANTEGMFDDTQFLGDGPWRAAAPRHPHFGETMDDRRRFVEREFAIVLRRGPRGARGRGHSERIEKPQGDSCCVS